MKKVIISIPIIIVLVILTALTFDWGRSGELLPDYNKNNSSTNTLIIVDNIKDNQEVSNPITILGKARGNWYFEASFPVKLVDLDGNVLVSTFASAQSDWMTTDFVNFSVTLEYVKSTSTDRALIVLSKDNPSGLPEFDQSIYIPVILK